MIAPKGNASYALPLGDTQRIRRLSMGMPDVASVPIDGGAGLAQRVNPWDHINYGTTGFFYTFIKAG